MIAAPGFKAYEMARRMVGQGMRVEDAAARTGFAADNLAFLIERERTRDLGAWQALGDKAGRSQGASQ